MRFLVNRLRTRQALNYLATGEYAKSREKWRKLAKGRENAQGVRHNIALTYIGEEDYENAEPLLLAEIEDFGEHYPRLKALADLYYVWRKREEAHTWYQKTLEAGSPKEERALLKKRISLTADDESFAEVCRSLDALKEGNDLLAEEDWQEALSRFQEAVALDPTNIQALNNIGTIQLNYEKRPSQAAQTFRRAMSWSPLPWLKQNLAQAEKAQAQSQ